MPYLKSEILKSRRSFARALIFLAPAVTVLLSALAPQWFEISSMNLWYAFLHPGFLSLLCVSIEQRDGDGLQYRTVFPLPVSLSGIWLAKIGTAALYVLLGNLVFFALNLLGGFLVAWLFGQSVMLGVSRALPGIVCLVAASLWELPLCLYLARKTGPVFTLLVNAGVGSALGVVAAPSSLWFLCPYSWAPRLMIPILRILPNGTLADGSAPPTPGAAIAAVLAAALVLFVSLSRLTAKRFAGKEAAG